MNGHEIFEEYVKKFKVKSDQEIIELFNRQVGIPGWCTSRASHIAAIRHEMKRRGFDYSKVGGQGRLSFNRKIKLAGKKVLFVDPAVKNDNGPNVIVVKPYLDANPIK